MPVLVEKSVRAGPFRFDVLQGGTGLSSASIFAKIGFQPRAHHIGMGTSGTRYQTAVKRAEPRDRRQVAIPSEPKSLWLGNVQMVEVESGDVLDMRDEAFTAVLDEINQKQKVERLAVVLPVLALLTAFVIGYMWQSGLVFPMLVAALPLWLIGKWLDAYRRSTVLVYELGNGADGVFGRLTEAFDRMMDCAGQWHVEAGGAVTDLATWKQNAGAGYLVRRNVTDLSYHLPKGIKSNVTPPALQVGRQVLYFFPDIVLVQDGSTFGAVAYAELRIHWQVSDSIEHGEAPADAQVVGYTWQHPNRNGGPDRRFRSNRQLPVCRYEALHISSPNGLNELVEFSRLGVGQSFAAAIASLATPYRQAGRSTDYGSYGNAFSLTWRSPG